MKCRRFFSSFHDFFYYTLSLFGFSSFFLKIPDRKIVLKFHNAASILTTLSLKAQVHIKKN